MALDLSADQLLLDGLETVTLHSENVDFPITDAYRTRQDTTNQDHAGGDYWHVDTTFHFPVHPVAVPIIGDTITDAGLEVFNIVEVREPAYNDAWICRCRRAMIAPLRVPIGLEDQVTLWRAVETTDAWGSTITTHPIADVAFGTVNAAITLRPSVVAEELGQQDFVEQYDIHVAKDVDTVHFGDILKDQDGHQYTIVSYQNRQQIDELSVILCEDRIAG